jgi:hypothetical protein
MYEREKAVRLSVCVCVRVCVCVCVYYVRRFFSVC